VDFENKSASFWNSEKLMILKKYLSVPYLK
jgi:hypothetical protein